MAGCSTDVVILIVEELMGCNWEESLEKHLGRGGQGWVGQMGKKSLKQLLENPRKKKRKIKVFINTCLVSFSS